jgi:hypothetical protein
MKNQIPISKLHGKTIYEWTALGLRSMKEIKEYAEREKEKRMDIIGQNGNEGLHYCPDQQKDGDS